MSFILDEHHGFINLLRLLIRSPSVVGAEHSFFHTLQRELEERGAKVTWYEGVLVAQGSDPNSLMFSAHADRHGLICTGPNEFQYAAFVAGSRSDLLGNSVSEQLMYKIADRFTDVGVYGYEPYSGYYCGRGTIKKASICEHRKNLIFEVDGLSHLNAGTPVAFNDNLTIKNNQLIAQLDNVLTVATLVYLFECGFQGTAFFTAQEEAGKSWRYLLEWFRRFGKATNQLIVLDTSPFASTAEADRQQVILRHKDVNGVFNAELTNKLQQQCEALNITYRFKDSYIEEANELLIKKGEEPKSLGSTEMGRIVAASDGLVDGTTLQIPTTGYHTMEEATSIVSVEAFMRLLFSLAKLT